MLAVQLDDDCCFKLLHSILNNSQVSLYSLNTVFLIFCINNMDLLQLNFYWPLLHFHFAFFEIIIVFLLGAWLQFLLEIHCHLLEKFLIYFNFCYSFFLQFYSNHIYHWLIFNCHLYAAQRGNFSGLHLVVALFQGLCLAFLFLAKL